MALRIEDEIVLMVGEVHRLARAVARHDGDLANQMKRAASSVGLNAAEGLWARKGNRVTRLDSAMCSGRETRMALQIAGAAGYLEKGEAAVYARELDRIVATLHVLAHKRR
jgi:four helix bundle protein